MSAGAVRRQVQQAALLAEGERRDVLELHLRHVRARPARTGSPSAASGSAGAPWPTLTTLTLILGYFVGEHLDLVGDVGHPGPERQRGLGVQGLVDVGSGGPGRRRPGRPGPLSPPPPQAASSQALEAAAALEIRNLRRVNADGDDIAVLPEVRWCASPPRGRDERVVRRDGPADGEVGAVTASGRDATGRAPDDQAGLQVDGVGRRVGRARSCERARTGCAQPPDRRRSRPW